MANKTKKKRNKVYRGADASLERPVVTRISAVHRSRVGQWWFDNKKVARPIIIVSLIVLALSLLIYQIIRLVSGS